MYRYIRPLFDGPIDVVGDIHGEIDALDALLARLGYDRDGRHPKGRHLVFVGDFVDRGPDSPAVVERVATMVEAGRAQCVLGNHELNLLRGESKEGNGWFRDEAEDHDLARGLFPASRRASATQRADFLRWFDSQPVALERPGLRVVHACWHADAITALRDCNTPPSQAYDAFSRAIADTLERTGKRRQREAELAQWGAAIRTREAHVPMLDGVAAIDVAQQSDHPLKAITSGLERQAPAPFWATSKWRMTERIAWWNEYADTSAVVFGHYWRWPLDEQAATARARGPNLFAGAAPFDWLGPRHNTLCIDWCVGLRWSERQHGAPPFLGKLGALRLDERAVVLDS